MYFITNNSSFSFELQTTVAIRSNTALRDTALLSGWRLSEDIIELESVVITYIDGRTYNANRHT